MAMATEFPSKSFYSSTNPFYALGKDYVGECTWYAWGRAHEVTGETGLPNSSAGKWYQKASGFTKYGPTATPVAPGIGCFSHYVVFIESVSNGNVTFSEANYYSDSRLSNGKIETENTSTKGTDGVLKTLAVKDFLERSGGGSYQGCIAL